MTLDELIKQRAEARKVGDYETADNLRKRAREKGIILEDNADGTTFWRVAAWNE